MKSVLIVGAGGFIGAVLRYAVTLLAQAKGAAQFPTHTLAVNIAGCFLIGIVFGFSGRGHLPHGWTLFLATGVLGGFTTFSAFSNETFILFREGRALHAALYVSASVILGLSATFLAYWLMNLAFPRGVK